MKQQNSRSVEDGQQPVIILQIPAEDDTAEQNNVAVAVVAIQVINPANNKKKSKMKRLQKQLSSDLSNYWDVTNSPRYAPYIISKEEENYLLQSLVHITMSSVAAGGVFIIHIDIDNKKEKCLCGNRNASSCVSLPTDH